MSSLEAADDLSAAFGNLIDLVREQLDRLRFKAVASALAMSPVSRGP
jgi:hypothetical protein